jgi:hypothetical protein
MIDDVIFITLTNSGYIDYTLNCIESLKRLGLNDLLHCYCIGTEGHNRLLSCNVKSILINDEENSAFQLFNQGRYSNVVYYKFKIISENLDKYKYVCITDGDITFENKDLFKYLLENIKDNDMLIQNDCMNDADNRNLCSGFMFIKSNDKTRYIFSPDNMYMDFNKVGWGDQLYINEIKNKLVYKKLPLNLFPNGQFYYKHGKNLNPYLIHFNWVIGHEKKMKMIKHNKWLL